MKPTRPVHYNAFDEKGHFVFSLDSNSRNINMGSTLTISFNEVERTFVITEKEEIPNLVNKIFDLEVVESFLCDFV